MVHKGNIEVNRSVPSGLAMNCKKEYMPSSSTGAPVPLKNRNMQTIVGKVHRQPYCNRYSASGEYDVIACMNLNVTTSPTPGRFRAVVSVSSLCQHRRRVR